MAPPERTAAASPSEVGWRPIYEGADPRAAQGRHPPRSRVRLAPRACACALAACLCRPRARRPRRSPCACSRRPQLARRPHAPPPVCRATRAPLACAARATALATRMRARCPCATPGRRARRSPCALARPLRAPPSCRRPRRTLRPRAHPPAVHRRRLTAQASPTLRPLVSKGSRAQARPTWQRIKLRVSRHLTLGACLYLEARRHVPASSLRLFSETDRRGGPCGGHVGCSPLRTAVRRTEKLSDSAG